MMFNSLNDFIGPLDNSVDTIITANNTPIYSQGKGKTVTFGDKVLYVPQLHKSLISTSADDRLGNYTIFGNQRVYVFDQPPIFRGKLIRKGILSNGLYIYDNDNQVSTNLHEALQAHVSPANARILHLALGHLPISRINLMIQHKAAVGLPSLPILGSFLCENCLISKARATPMPSAIARRKRLYLPSSSYKKFEIVGFDIVDIGPVVSMQGNSYFVVLLDFSTNYSSVYFIKSRDDLLTLVLIPFISDLVTPLNGQIIKFQCDDEIINKSASIREYLLNHGNIKMRFSSPYKLAQNGRVERRIGLISSIAATCMLDFHAPPSMCESAILYAVDCINVTLNNRNKSITPFEEMFNKKPVVNNKIPFYLPAIFKPSKEEWRKLKPSYNKFKDRGLKCNILRLHPDYKDSYEIFIPALNKFTVRYNVKPLLGLVDDNSVTKWLAIDSSSNAIESENDRLATDSRHSNDSLSQSQINEHLNNNYLPELSNSGGDSSYNNNNNLEQNNNIPTSSSSTIYLPDLSSSGGVLSSPIIHPPELSDSGGDTLINNLLNESEISARMNNNNIEGLPESSVNDVYDDAPPLPQYDTCDDADTPDSPLPSNTSKRKLMRSRKEENEKLRNQKLIDEGIIRRKPMVDAINKRRSVDANRLVNDLGDYWQQYTVDVPYDSDAETRSRIHKKGNRKTRRLIEELEGKPTKPLSNKSRLNMQRREKEAERIMLANKKLDGDFGLPPTPNSVEEALAEDNPYRLEWQAAMENERLAIHSHKTFQAAPEHKGRMVKSKVAFRVTREPDGSFKFKARLVAKGFTERKGYVYFNTFAPVAMTKSVNMILHIAAHEDWAIRNLDVGGAYLEADLDTDLWMEVPAEFAIDGCTVVKLIKSIYGLKQSGELWNKKVNDIFTDMNFVRCPEDPCVYSRTNDSTGERTYICLYVDDGQQSECYPRVRS